MPLAPVTRIDSGMISQTRLRCLESSEQWRSRSAFSTVEAAKNQQSPTMNNGFQHGVIPGSSQTKAQRISSLGTDEAILMWPRNDGERQWNIMLDWTCR